MGNYGLLGHPLGHSFSKAWFEARGHDYDLLDFEQVSDFFATRPNDLEGFNVTIPHKQAVLPYLDALDATAAAVGAVNCVVVEHDGRLTGYNTDVVGFGDSLVAMLPQGFQSPAAVLGSGGAAKAVLYILNTLQIPATVISRGDGGYDRFDPAQFPLIINTTPLGMYPKVDAAPEIDYSKITAHHFCYDLVYNPGQTLFLKRCRRQGATVRGGLAMLDGQARAALQLFSAR